MKIAICDDASQYRAEIKNYISEYSLNNTDCFEFSCAEDLLARYEQGERFDIVFLDVEMDGVDGVSAGIKIREYDSKVIIIFVSSYPKYAISAYDCEAFYFVVKPIDSDKFKQVLTKAIEKHTLLHQYYIIKNKGETKKIAVKDIIYVELSRKHLIFHTNDGNYQTIGKISDAATTLSPYGFCQVHQGFVVNMNRIKEFVDYDAVMDDGSKVMISVRKKTDVLRTYAAYLERTL